MVDYSKWDKLDYSDSDEEPSVPSVTRLDKPTTVSLASGAPTSSAAPTPALAPKSSDIDSTQPTTTSRAGTGAGAGSGTGAGSALPSSVPDSPDWTRNGYASADGSFLFCQSASEVTVCAVVPDDTRGKDVNVRWQPPETFTEPPTLVVTVSGGEVLRRRLEYPLAPETVEDDTVDWEMKDWKKDGLRLVRVTFPKRQMGLGAVHWWKRVFADDDQSVDPKAISGRSPSSSSSSPSSMQQVWDEAHAMFRQRVKERKAAGPIILDTEVEEEGEETKN